MEVLKSREKGKLKESKTCRIFFSSPFGGMEEEREELTRKYFPQIQHACNAKGIQFVAVDMRWGITSQAAENAQVINICLRELDRSDLFVGFFGQRYGWHGSEDKQLQDNFDNSVRNYPWLDTVRDRSVTELEFLHGHLNDPGALPACICFRDKSYDDIQREEGLSKGDKKQVFKYSSESEHATAMMDDLKERVNATESKCLGVDMAYSHPHEGAQFMFESIWPYLTNVLLANANTTETSKREQQLEEHDAFRAPHFAVYDGGQPYLDYLNSKLTEGQGNVLIKGPAGSGKSALLCNWTMQLEKSHPELALIYHFIGCAPGTTGDHDILSRLLMEVRHVLTSSEGDKKPEDPKEDTQDIQTLQNLLLRAVEEVVRKEQKQVVIVLDGLDRSPKAGKTSKHLYWLPHTWPPGVLFIASTVDTDTTTCELLINERHYQPLTILPLDEKTQQEICVKVLKKSGKELSPEQLDRIVAAEQTSNPLYLRLVLSELSIFGYFRLLDKKIDSLICSSDVGDLLQKIFTRLEEDYNGKDNHNRLVEKVLCAIELSNHGLLEKEIMEMLEVESHEWLPLYFAMEGLLISHAGLLRFGFAEISQAVRAKYFQDEEEKKCMLKKLIEYFNKKLQSIPVWDDLMTPLSKRPVEELPWLQLALGDLDGLSNTLLNIFTLHRLQTHFEYEFFELWKATGKKMSEVCDCYIHGFNIAVAEFYLHHQDLTLNSMPLPGLALRSLLTSMEKLFTLANFPQGAAKVLQRDIDVLMHVKGKISSDLRFKMMMETCYRLACALVDSRKLKEGEESHRQIMASCREFLEEHPDDRHIRQTLGHTCNGVGVVCINQQRWEEATAMFEESMKHHSMLGNTESVASCYDNLGLTYLHKGDLQLGLTHMQKALEIYEDQYFGQLPLSIGNLLTNMGLCYRRLGDLDKAEAEYTRSLEVKINAVGADHDVVAAAYMNLSTLNMYRNDFTKAEMYIRKCMTILEGNGATLDVPDYLKATENLVACLLNLSRMEEALPIYLPLFHKLKEGDRMNHCISSVQLEMAKHLLHSGDTDTAREVILALINSSVRDPVHYILLDHLQLMLPEDQRPQLPEHCTLDYALQTLWPGNAELSRRIVEFHALPAGDIDRIVQLVTVCAENNREWEAYNYQAFSEWCIEHENKEAAAQVLEAGTKDYPDNLDLRLQLMDLYRKQQEFSRAYPHLPVIIEGRKDDPATMIVSGDIAMRSSDYEMALKCFDRVSTLDDPDLAERAVALATELRKALAEYSEDAIETSDQDPGNPENGEREPKKEDEITETDQ